MNRESGKPAVRCVDEAYRSVAFATRDVRSVSRAYRLLPGVLRGTSCDCS